MPHEDYDWKFMVIFLFKEFHTVTFTTTSPRGSLLHDYFDGLPRLSLCTISSLGLFLETLISLAMALLAPSAFGL